MENINVKMFGIEHTNAKIEEREKFSFSETRAKEFLLKLKENKLNAIIVSTCNRTEIWISYDENDKIDIDVFELLCKFKNVNKQEYEKYFVFREEKKAVEHLFMLTAGLKSKIIGEDQIITQVKNAIEIARKVKSLDKTLDILFRHAVTAGKKVKTEVKFRKGSYSIIDMAIKKIEELGVPISQKKCLIIGNGEMGMLAVKTLLAYGANTSLTLREHHKSDITIPFGANVEKFSDRICILPKYDVVFSTTSTHRYMVKYEDIFGVKLKENMIFVDLAIPRDIEPKIFEIDGIIGFDVDDFEASKDDIETYDENLKKTIDILNDYINDFYHWNLNKKANFVVFEASKKMCDDAIWRIGKEVDDYTKSCIKKAVEKLIFTLRDECSAETFKEVIEKIEDIYLKEVE